MSAPTPTDWAAILAALDDESVSVRREAAERAVAALFLGPGPAEAFAVFERGLSDPSLEVQALCGRAAVLTRLDAKMGFIKPVAATVRRVHATGSSTSRRVVETCLDNTVEHLGAVWRFPDCFCEVLNLGLDLNNKHERHTALRGLVETEISEGLRIFPVERLGRFLRKPTPPQLQKSTLGFIKRAAAAGADLGPLLPALRLALNSKAEFIAYHAGMAMIAHALAANEHDLVQQLFQHINGEVRQGAAEGLKAAASKGVDLSAHAQTLGEALDDEWGGVVFHIMKALLHPRSHTPLEATVPFIQRALARPTYSAQGWVGDEALHDRDTLSGESLAQDACTVLERWGIQPAK